MDSSFTLNLKFSNWGTTLGLVFALMWFYAWKAYRKSQGVNLDRRYAEYPDRVGAGGSGDRAGGGDR